MIEVDEKEALKEELKKQEKVLALFYASWCPYCTAFVPSFNRKVADFKSGTVIHVLLDDFDNPLWDEFDIEAVPTIIYFERGDIAKRLDGRFGVGLNMAQFEKWLKETNLH